MPPDFLLPFGPFHVVVQHLPIGLLFGVWVLECFARKTGKGINAPLAWLHTALLLATAATIALGIAYQSQGGYGSEIDKHRQWGLLFGAGLLASHLLFWLDTIVRHGLTRVFYILTLTLTTVALVVSGHLGGELIHGKGFLLKPFEKAAEQTVQPAPEKPPSPRENPAPAKSIDTVLPAPPKNTLEIQAPAEKARRPASQADAPDTVALFHAARTVFERNCFACHGSTRKKGGYRLDTRQALFTPGKSDIAPILAGNPNQSHIIQRMTLPREHDEAMPPIEKDPVPASDIEAVRAWILAGAYWPTDVEIRAAADSFKDHGNAATDQLLAAISATGVKAEYNAWGDDSVRIDLAVVHPGQLNSALEALRQFGPELVWLDTSNLELPDSFFEDLAGYASLQRLHLDGTNVTDDRLRHIGLLKQLQYLNLHNTRITDQSLRPIQYLPALRKLYLGATDVSEQAIDALRQARPGLQIVHRPPAPILGSTGPAQPGRR